MGAQRSSFDKLQRDRAKKAKQAAKRERRQDKIGEDGTAEPWAGAPVITDHQGDLSAAELLVMIESLHQRRAAEAISLDDFEDEKAELLARLPID